MANFRNSKTFGRNQFALAGGVSTYFHGRDGFGQLGPARAFTDYDYELEEEVPGWAPCLTEVIDWPFSEDENGIAFDQGNLYGVRTRCWRQPVLDGGGDKEDNDSNNWVAVPRTLPSGYTIKGRCQHLNPPQIQDFLGDVDPYTYSSINIRNAVSNDVFADYPYKKGWTPMNRGDQGYVTNLGPHTGTIPGIPDSNENTATIATDHIGFRAGKIVTTIGDPTTGFDNSGILKFYHRDSGDSGDAAYIGEISMSYTSNGSAQVIEKTLPEMLAKTLGTLSNFYAIGINTIRDNDGVNPFTPSDPPTYSEVIGGWLVSSSSLLYLGPRTDVPLWYFAATGNKCAPGGIVT